MIFDTDVMIWTFRGNTKALDTIDAATERSISSVTYMELLQDVRNKQEMISMKRFLSTLGFSILPVTANISSRAMSIEVIANPGIYLTPSSRRTRSFVF